MLKVEQPNLRIQDFLAFQINPRSGTGKIAGDAANISIAIDTGDSRAPMNLTSRRLSPVSLIFHL